MADLGFTREGTMRKNPEMVSDAMKKDRLIRQTSQEDFSRSLKLWGQRAEEDIERNKTNTGKLQFVKKNWDKEANIGKITRMKTCDWGKDVGGKIQILDQAHEKEQANYITNAFSDLIVKHNE